MTRNTHELDYDHRGSFGSNARFSTLSLDPAATASSTIALYAKGAGLYTIDSAGTVVGPLGAATSGSGAYGSNANDVGNPSTGGANSSNSRADHVHLGIRAIAANSSNNLTQPNVGLVSGTGIAFGVSGSTLTISATGSGGGGGGSVSYGSNATDVSSTSAAGASTNVAREDHVHKGVHQITSNTSNAKFGDINLQAGSGIALGVAAQVITITNTGTGSGGGSGGSTTIQYPALKVATPTYDFATASLPGAFSAHSNAGTFVTGNCITQGVDWVGSSLEMQLSEQFGQLYVSHSNGDLDVVWGGVRANLPFHEDSSSEVMIGLAALDSSGTGVGVVAYTADTNAYFATITAWGYTTFSDSWVGRVMSSAQGAATDLWFRITRVSGTWTGYVSKSGRVWDKTFSTRADSITVDRIAIGIWFDSSKVYSGRITSDFLHVAV